MSSMSFRRMPVPVDNPTEQTHPLAVVLSSFYPWTREMFIWYVHDTVQAMRHHVAD